MSNKKCRISIRLSESLKRKLLAICDVTGKTQTSIIEDLILLEFRHDKKYEDRYYSNLNREVLGGDRK